MIEEIKFIVALASLWTIMFAPFLFLNKFASNVARARARAAINESMSGIDARPLSNLADRIFGLRHLSLRCFFLSTMLTTLLALIFLGVLDRTTLSVSDYILKYTIATGSAEQQINKAMRTLLPTIQFLEGAAADLPDQLRKLKATEGEIRASLDTQLWNGTQLAAWMLLSMLTVNILCDYAALWKSRQAIRLIGQATSGLAVTAYLALDFLLGAAIWITGSVIFVFINLASFSLWLHETGPLVLSIAVVSLITTLATSVWLYAYVLGWIIAALIQRGLALSFLGITKLIDPKEHEFKIIGLVGATILTASMVLMLRLAR